MKTKMTRLLEIKVTRLDIDRPIRENEYLFNAQYALYGVTIPDEVRRNHAIMSDVLDEVANNLGRERRGNLRAPSSVTFKYKLSE